MPQYLKGSDATTKQLPSYIYSKNDKKWIDIKHEKKNNDEKDSKNDEKKDNDNNKQNVKELTIVSYNIWFADKEWQKRQQKLLSMLEEINPDIFCLQEVTPRFLAGFCDHKYIQQNFELTEKKDNYKSTVVPYGVMIGCNKTKNNLSMKEVKICALTSNMGRRLISSCIKLNNDKEIWINTVHLESLLNRDVRIDQLKNIFGVYMKDQGESMLMGDFNFGDYSPENQSISNEFIDCWKEYKKTLTDEQQNNPRLGHTGFGTRYDRILLRTEKWKVDKFLIIGKPNMPSDHLGVVTKLIAK